KPRRDPGIDWARMMSLEHFRLNARKCSSFFVLSRFRTENRYTLFLEPLLNLTQRRRHGVEVGIQVAAHRGQHTDNDDRDQGGNQAILDGGGAVLIGGEFLDHSNHGWTP